MTREQVKKQALARLRITLRPNLLEKADRAADLILEPYKKRDETEVDGKRIESYNFQWLSVLWLERKIREMLKI
jgi:hypothetical protein